MQKELNLEIFGEVKSPSRVTAHRTMNEANEPAFLNTDRQIFELKSQMTQMNQQLEKINQTLNDSMRQQALKTEKFQQNIHRLEQSHNGLASEVGQKLSSVAQKMGERRSLDLKIQEMVDRHNNIIKSFEVRMNHLQKILQEREAQIVATQTALNDAKMEIQRLKRM